MSYPSLRPVATRYDDVIDDLRTAYDGGVERRDRKFAPGTFDAVYAMNCLLHVPNADLPAVLAQIRAVLRPGGLFFLGVYGGDGTEGIATEDWHTPPRFFSWRTDEQLRAFAQEFFAILDFHVVEGDSPRFQSLALLRPEDAERLGEAALG